MAFCTKYNPQKRKKQRIFREGGIMMWFSKEERERRKLQKEQKNFGRKSNGMREKLRN